ncbi:S9 family peptidase [Corallincola luteus]|uniref:S9 family peptidase n=2 Tax=Corallincola TaxID=1775176 RepID=A0A368NLW3_9GAMM|nr:MULTISPECIES: S9 family peptidase [Corallincola]RCU50429.1 S9 family peptidase [Corallincola holothuriorum]TCI05582.1 S9 family peptidase [Corallincola luteus]
MIKIIGLLLVFCWTSLAQAAPLTLEDLSKVQRVVEQAASPAGKEIAYVLQVPRTVYKDDDGKPYYHLYMTDEAGVKRPFITGKVVVKRLKWSADGKTLYFLAKRGEQKFVSLWSIPVDGGEAQPLYEHSRNISEYDISPDGQTILFVGREKKPGSDKKLKTKGFKAQVYEEERELARLWKLDLNQEKLEASMIERQDNVLFAKFSPDGSRWLLKVSPNSSIDDIYMKSTLKITDDQGKLLAAIVHEGKMGTAEWSPSGEHLLFIGSESIHDPADGRLYLADVKGGKPVELLPDYMGHVKAIGWLTDKQALYVGHEGVESTLGMVNIDSQRQSTLIPTGKAIFHRFSVNGDGQIALIGDTPVHPNELYLKADVASDVARLTQSNPWLEEAELAEQKAFTYNARDGLPLGGVLVLPLNYQEGERYPLIMFVHGGPEAHISNGWVNRYSNPAQVAAAKGYVSFFPNYRGSTGKGVKFSMLGQNDYAGKEFDDLVDAKKALVAAGLVDNDKAGITGGSYGGYASAWGATAQSEHFAASVMFVGVSDLISKFGTTDIPNEMYLVHARSWPWEHWQDMLERSPVYHAQKHRTPLLIMHGKDDPRVHPSQSLELYRYLKTLNKAPVRLVWYPGEGHGNRKAAAQYDYSLRLMRWMDFYLQGEGDGKAIPPHELPHAESLDQENSK